MFKHTMQRLCIEKRMKMKNVQNIILVHRYTTFSNPSSHFVIHTYLHKMCTCAHKESKAVFQGIAQLHFDKCMFYDKYFRY